MKTTFYCVNVEFYDNFDEDNRVLFTEVKACVTEKQANKKPKNSYRQLYGMAAFRFHMTDANEAKKLLDGIKSGDLTEDHCIAIFNLYSAIDHNQKIFNKNIKVSGAA